MTKTQVNIDNCGFETIIEAISTDDYKIKLTIKSDCESIQKIAQELKEIEPFQIIGRPFADCLIYQVSGKYLRHTACLIPSAIIRTIEVESGMALPGDSTMKIRKE